MYQLDNLPRNIERLQHNKVILVVRYQYPVRLTKHFGQPSVGIIPVINRIQVKMMCHSGKIPIQLRRLVWITRNVKHNQFLFRRVTSIVQYQILYKRSNSAKIIHNYMCNIHKLFSIPFIQAAVCNSPSFRQKEGRKPIPCNLVISACQKRGSPSLIS